MDAGRLAQGVAGAGEAEEEAEGGFGDPEGAGFVSLAQGVGEFPLVFPGGWGDEVDARAAAADGRTRSAARGSGIRFIPC